MKEAPNRNGSSQCCPMKVGEHCWPGSLRAMFCDAHTALLTHTHTKEAILNKYSVGTVLIFSNLHCKKNKPFLLFSFSFFLICPEFLEFDLWLHFL